MITKSGTEVLTDRQRAVLKFVARCWSEGEVPTIRMIGEKFGYPGNAARTHLIALRKKGFIAKDRRAGARLTEKTKGLL